MTTDHSHPERTLNRMDTRTVLLTGASSGIGAGIATAFAEAGAKVYAAARRVDLIPAAVGEQLVEDGRVIPVELDVSDAAAVGALGRRLAETDPIDTLVCAAGINVPNRRIGSLTIDAWDQMVAINLSGVFYCLHATIECSQHGFDVASIELSSLAS